MVAWSEIAISMRAADSVQLAGGVFATVDILVMAS